MFLSVFFLLSAIFSKTVFVQANHLGSRVKRGILGTYTTTIFKTIEEKHYIPASCVHFEPNLPDCRNVRFINFPSFTQNGFSFFNTGNEISPTSTPNVIATKRSDTDSNQSEPSKAVGWGEYLGFYRPTVTVTELKIRPTTMLDPRIVVTYAVKGCKPHNLPKELERCPDDESLELAEILPTSTVMAKLEATKMTRLEQGGILEGGEVEHVENLRENHSRATKSL